MKKKKEKKRTGNNHNKEERNRVAKKKKEHIKTNKTNHSQTYHINTTGSTEFLLAFKRKRKREMISREVQPPKTTTHDWF